jgi:DNA-binding NarL/FixJ family response regulator
MTTRLLIVDDHPVFRSGLAGLLDTMDDVSLLASVGTAEEALDVIEAEHPDVVVMDLNLPGQSGIAATREISERFPTTEVLVVTMVGDDESVLAAVRAGARGYVLKGAPAGEIAAAVRTVAAGGAVFGAALAHRLLAIRASAPTPLEAPGGALTQRESEVLELLARGSNNHQIARDLGLSLKTVQNHVSRILDKLQVGDRTAAALKARGVAGEPSSGSFGTSRPTA